jgi:phosphoglycerate kinase
MNKKSIRDVNFKDKRVLVRVDFNVPLEGNTITDDTRIRASVPTIEYILKQSPKAIILTSHLGRPKGERNLKYSLAPAAPVLAQYLGVPVAFAEDCVGEIAENAVAELPDGGVILLENTRFYKGEEKNDPELAAQFARLADIFVNDAFGTAHRAHASNVGVADHMQAVAGFLLEKEIDYLATAIENPVRPFVAILGGAKVSDKIKVIEALLTKVDHLLIGGGMANTFAAAQGYAMGKSLVEQDAIETAKQILATSSDKIMLPVDGIAADAFDNGANHKVVQIAEGIEGDWQVLDIGPKTIAAYSEILAAAKTVVWNGPMGVFEMPTFATGTFEIARMLAESTAKGATTIIGGGDSAAAAEQSGLAEQITHISTGGGASLELLEGIVLPGLASLADR